LIPCGVDRRSLLPFFGIGFVRRWTARIHFGKRAAPAVGEIEMDMLNTSIMVVPIRARAKEIARRF